MIITYFVHSMLPCHPNPNINILSYRQKTYYLEAKYWISESINKIKTVTVYLLSALFRKLSLCYHN